MAPWEVSARVALVKLIGDYTRAVDAGDTAAVAALFVEDAVFELPGETRFAGRASIVAGLSELAKAMSAAADSQEQRPIRHMANPSLISFPSAHRAELETLFLVIAQSGLTQWGRWLDQAVEQDGAWRFERHRIVIDGQAARGPA